MNAIHGVSNASQCVVEEQGGRAQPVGDVAPRGRSSTKEGLNRASEPTLLIIKGVSTLGVRTAGLLASKLEDSVELRDEDRRDLLSVSECVTAGQRVSHTSTQGLWRLLHRVQLTLGCLRQTISLSVARYFAQRRHIASAICSGAPAERCAILGK